MSSTTGNRAAAWAMLAVSGFVVFGSAADTYTPSNRSNTIKWAMAISFIVGFFALCLAFFSIKGNKTVELGASFVLACLWIFIVDTFGNPARKNGTSYAFPDQNGALVPVFEFGPGYEDVITVNEVYLPNLWYFTWIGFLSAIFVMGLSLGDNKRRVAEALAVFVVSIAVLSKAATIKDMACVRVYNSLTMCGRTKFIISVGVICMVFALVGVAMMASAAINAGCFFINAVMYFCGVAFGTSASGPGAYEGTLYYLLWFGALASSSVFFSCIAELKGGGEEGDAKKGEEKQAEAENVAENTAEP